MTEDPAAPARDEVHRHLAEGIRAAEVLGLETRAAEAAAAGADPAAARAALVELAAAAGIAGPVRELVTERIRRRTINSALGEVALLLDMDGLERAALAVTRERASRRGAGPIGLLRTALHGGRRTAGAVPPPADHLREWRRRGSLAPVAELIDGAVTASLPAMPAGLRAGYAAALDPAELEIRLGGALDRMRVREEPETTSPPSHLRWRVLGALQWLNLGLLVASIAWIVSMRASAAPVPVFEFPFLDELPLPLALLGLSIAAGVLLALGLRSHADRVGRRWARRLEVVVRIGARQVVEAHAFTSVDRLESARLRLAEAAIAQMADSGG
jgi:hypothetical protein